MKALLLCTVAAFVIGIGTGWWLKPSTGIEAGPQEKTKAAKHEGRRLAAASAGSIEGDPEQSKSGPRMASSGGKGGVLRPDLRKGAVKIMLDSMEERCAKRTEARIAELVAKLGLNPQQEARLRAHFDSLKPEVKVDEDGNSLRVNSMPKLSPQEREASFAKLMGEMLTEEQQETYEAFKETERNQQVEARALRDMASLTQAVELREDQRDAVYEVLQNDARNETGHTMETGMPAVGVFTNTDFGPGPGAEATVMRMAAPGTEGMDQEEAATQERARIDGKMERLSGVLDAAQLAAYRSYLEQGTVFPGP